MTPGFDDNGNGSPFEHPRLPALLIAALVTVMVCLVATWPRWHAAPATLAAAGGTSDAAASDVPATAPSGSAVAPDTVTGPAAGTAGVAGVLPGTGSAANAVATTAVPVTLTGSTPPPRAPVPGGAAPRKASAEDWSRLSDAQKSVLAPFAATWNEFSPLQKKKWLTIASVYPGMAPEAQQRLHARMLRWAQMTNAERKLARENYEMSRVLPPNARQQAWRAYQALPPAQKEKLAAEDRSHRRPLVVSAPPVGRATSAQHPPRHNGVPKTGPLDPHRPLSPASQGPGQGAAATPTRPGSGTAAAATGTRPAGTQGSASAPAGTAQAALANSDSSTTNITSGDDEDDAKP